MTKIKLLFTCPHNGTQHTDKVRVIGDLPNTCIRSEFSIVNDIGTEDLTERIITHIHRLSGKDPYKQIAKVDREYMLIITEKDHAHLKSQIFGPKQLTRNITREFCK